MGAHFLLEIFEGVDLSDLLGRADVPVIATSSHADKQLYELDLRQPVAWLFGHEGQGVADDLLARATYRVSIPHLGAIESLNVAASRIRIYLPLMSSWSACRAPAKHLPACSWRCSTASRRPTIR